MCRVNVSLDSNCWYAHFFDGKSTIPIDMSLHCEKGKKKDFGLTAKQRKNRFSKKRKKEDPNFMRFKESTDSKLQVAVEMLKRAWAHKSLRAKYVLCDSWFTCEYFISEVLKRKRPKMSQRPYLRAFCKARKFHF